MNECSLCLKTPRELRFQVDIDRVPLMPPLPPDAEISNFRTQCPECSADYVSSRSEEWDDGQCFATVHLLRQLFKTMKAE